MTQQLYGIVIDGVIIQELLYDSEEPRAPNVLPITVQEVPFDANTQTLEIQDAISDIGITRLWVVTDLPAPALKDSLIDVLTAKRAQEQNADVTVGNAIFKSDVQSQLALTNAYLSAMADDKYTLEWKVDDGKFVTLNATAIIAAWKENQIVATRLSAAEKSVSDDVAQFSKTSDVTAAFDAANA